MNNNHNNKWGFIVNPTSSDYLGELKKLLNVLLVLTGLIGYLEWLEDNRAFLFQMQYDLIFGSARDLKNFLHPAILFPFAGELILIYTLFQKIPWRVLTLIGLGCLAVIMIIVLVVGVASTNIKIAASALPFFIIAFFVLKYNLKKTEKTA